MSPCYTMLYLLGRLGLLRKVMMMTTTERLSSVPRWWLDCPIYIQAFEVISRFC